MSNFFNSHLKLMIIKSLSRLRSSHIIEYSTSNYGKHHNIIQILRAEFRGNKISFYFITYVVDAVLAQKFTTFIVFYSQVIHLISTK